MPCRAGPALLLAGAALWSAACVTPLVRSGAISEGAYERVLARTVTARELEAPEGLGREVVSASAVAPVLREAIREEYPAGEFEAFADAVTAFGLWPADEDLLEELLAISSEELAGFYVPAQRKLYLVDPTPRPSGTRLASWLLGRDFYGEMVLAHELVHALQHAHYAPLFDSAFRARQLDAAAALDAALEGDALHYGLLALGPSELPDPDELAASEDDRGLFGGRRAGDSPALLRLMLVSPYAKGYRLSLREGPLLLADPPVSTEQARHPERRREPFLAADLRGVASRLPGECRAVHEDTLGELGLRMLLLDLLGDDADPGLSEGWDGDRFLAARCAGRRAFLAVTFWDSEGDARAFAEAYREIAGGVAARGELLGRPRATLDGRRVVLATPDLDRHALSLLAGVPTARVHDLAGLRAFFARPAPGSADQKSVVPSSAVQGPTEFASGTAGASGL